MTMNNLAGFTPQVDPLTEKVAEATNGGWAWFHQMLLSWGSVVAADGTFFGPGSIDEFWGWVESCGGEILVGRLGDPRHPSPPRRASEVYGIYIMPGRFGSSDQGAIVVSVAWYPGRPPVWRVSGHLTIALSSPDVDMSIVEVLFPDPWEQRHVPDLDYSVLDALAEASPL